MEVDLGPGHIVLDGDPAALPQKRGRSHPAQFSAHFYCGQTVGSVRMPLGIEVRLNPGDFVLDGTQPPPNFPPMSIAAKRLDASRYACWYGGRPQARRLCVRSEPSPLLKKGAEPANFWAHVYCRQMAGWIKMPLGMEINLGPGDVVLDGVAAPPKGAQPPVFGSCILWPNG